MEHLGKLLAQLQFSHRVALEWFMHHSFTDQPWPKPLANGVHLAITHKGIYKPKGIEYAISVRQTLHNPYSDHDPVFRTDGTWSYFYHQETSDPELFTNRGLVACWRDRVPIGVMRQISAKPRVRDHVLGLVLVAGWNGGYFILECFAPDGRSRGLGLAASEIEAVCATQEEADPITQPFEPESIVDSRERIIASIVQRQGQRAFRCTLLELNKGRCAISDCDTAEVLEASHILPYRGPESNHPSNGLLLRADLYILFDLGLLTVDPSTMTVILAPSLCHTSYGELVGKPAGLPDCIESRPSVTLITQHRAWSGL